MVMSKLAKWQLVALVVVALLGLIYVGAKYVRLDNLLGFGQYTVKTELATSGGIFTNAEVTYRGVPVGRVGDMSLTSDGIEVDLLIDSSAPQIPASARAVVANRSAIGEQYVDLQPDTDQGPFLEDGSVIAVGDTTTPIPIENVLTSANGLVHSLPVDALHTVAKELGAAFNGKGEDLQVLADSLSGISQSGLDTLPQTLGLIRDSQTVLTTQSDQSSAIKQFSTDLDALTAQLRTSDPRHPTRDRQRHNRPANKSALSSPKPAPRSRPTSPTSPPLQRQPHRHCPRCSPSCSSCLRSPGRRPPLHRETAQYIWAWYSRPTSPLSCTVGYEGTMAILDEMKRKDPNFDDTTQNFPLNTAANCQAPQGSETGVRSANRIAFADPEHLATVGQQAQGGPGQAQPEPDCHSTRTDARRHPEVAVNNWHRRPSATMMM